MKAIKSIHIIWLTTSIVGTIVFLYFSGELAITPIVYLSIAATIGSAPAMLLYAYLAKLILSRTNYWFGKILLSLIALLLVAIIGYYPLLMWAELSRMKPTGSPHPPDLELELFIENILFNLLISYGTIFVCGIWLDKLGGAIKKW